MDKEQYKIVTIILLVMLMLEGLVIGIGFKSINRLEANIETIKEDRMGEVRNAKVELGEIMYDTGLCTDVIIRLKDKLSNDTAKSEFMRYSRDLLKTLIKEAEEKISRNKAKREDLLKIYYDVSYMMKHLDKEEK